MADAELFRALMLAQTRAAGEKRPTVANDLLRAVLDDPRSDARRLLAHLGLDPAHCRAEPSAPVPALRRAAEFAKEVGDVGVRTDHLLVVLLPAEDTVAMRAVIADRAAQPAFVPEPAGPPPRLPGHGALVAFCGLLFALALAVLAAMAWLTPPDGRPWLVGYGVLMSAIAVVPRAFPIVTQRTVDRAMTQIAAGQALLPIPAPIITDALLAAGMHRVETHLRQPGGKAPSKVVVHGRVTWIAFERAMLANTGAPYMVAYTATMAARRSFPRRQAAFSVGVVIALSCAMAFFLAGDTGHDNAFAVAPAVIGVLAGLLIFLGAHWYETIATIRTAAAWAGLAATDAWFDNEMRHRAVAKRTRRSLIQRTQPPFRLRQRVWAGPAGVYRAHARWHDTIRRVGGRARCQPGTMCDGADLVTQWLAPGLTIGELHRRLDAVAPGPDREADELAVWVRGLRAPGPERVAEVLTRADVRPATVGAVLRRLSFPDPAPLLKSTP